MAIVAAGAAFLGAANPVAAQSVTASVNAHSVIATFPEYGMGLHTSVYDNSLWHIDNPPNGASDFDDDNFDLLPTRLDEAGIDVLRYPGGGYADVFHFSVARPSWEGGLTGGGLSPYWGVANNYGYVASKTDFGNFVKLLDGTTSKAVITVNTGSAIKYDSPTKLGIPTHNGQPQEAAAWVAYANADPSIYGDPVLDIDLGVDAEGNDWKTAGYWARLRASTPSEFSAWADADGVYDSRNAFLAINRIAPVGIEYWEIGNETFGTGYYGGGPGETGYALNYAAPYDGSARANNALLSPAAYGQQVIDFLDAMKEVDPSIKVGAVLNTPPGDYAWGPDWNDQVLSQVDPGNTVAGTVADRVDFAIVHWYPTGNSTTILNHPRTTIPLMINGTTPGIDSGSNAGIRDSIATWRADDDGNALEIFITETDGGGSSETVDGLFAADAYITFFEHGISNVDWLELHQDDNPDPNIIGNGSFLNEWKNEPNYAFWGIQSVNLLADPGDDLVSTTTSESDVRIHASQREDGSVAVMIINMNTSSRTVNVTISGDTLLEDGVRYETNGDTALSLANVANLGNSFSTTIGSRILQLFIIPAAPILYGDFNGDNVVDAADYTVWRNNFDALDDSSILNRGDGAAGIDDGDYDIWKQYYGTIYSPGSGGLYDAVPEPASVVLLIGFALSMLGCRGARRWKTILRAT